MRDDGDRFEDRHQAQHLLEAPPRHGPHGRVGGAGAEADERGVERDGQGVAFERCGDGAEVLEAKAVERLGVDADFRVQQVAGAVRQIRVPEHGEGDIDLDAALQIDHGLCRSRLVVKSAVAAYICSRAGSVNTDTAAVANYHLKAGRGWFKRPA